MTFIIMAVVAAPLLIMGVFMRRGKGLMLLAGYNTMAEADREKIDKAALGKVAGNLLIRCGVEFLLLGLAIGLGQSWAVGILLAVAIIDPTVSAILMSRKFGSARQGAFSKGAGIVAVVITVIVLVFVVVLFVQGDEDPVVTMQDGGIKIEAAYGMTIPLEEVEAITLVEQPMTEIYGGEATRTNGYGGFGDAQKGNFRSEKLGKFMLFVRADSAPTILIERKDGVPVYISMEDGGKTRELYDELRTAV